MHSEFDDHTVVLKDRERAQAKRGTGRIVLEWGSKSLLAIIPALATGYFSMRESKFASDIEIARITAKAGAGYEALAETLKEESAQRKALAEEARRLAIYVEKLELRLDALAQSHVNRMKAETPTFHSSRTGSSRRSSATTERVERAERAERSELILGRGAASTSIEPKKLFQEQKVIQLPRSLDDAAKAKGL